MTEIFNKAKEKIDSVIEKIRERKHLRRYLKFFKNNLYDLQTSINSIDTELDDIRNGRLVVAESYIDTLLQRKLKIQQKIAETVAIMLEVEEKLKKGLF